MEFWKGLAELIAYIWPAEVVNQWEEGSRYRFGRFREVLAPGSYRRIPFFESIRTATMVPSVLLTPRLDITLADGAGLTYVASAQVRVIDSFKALNEVNAYQETTSEVLSSVLSDRLARVEPSRYEQSSRQRLLSDLTKWVNDETQLFGVEVSRVRFVMLLQRPKTFRLVGDIAGRVEDSF